MELIHKAIAQSQEFFLSMTHGARILVTLLVALIVLGLGYLSHHRNSGPNTFLMNGETFSADQLPTMMAAFAKAGLNDFEVIENRIRIPRGQNAAFLGALADAGALPPQIGSYFEKALSEGSSFMTRRDKQERLKIAKQRELNLILGKMRGIESAAVLFDATGPIGLQRTRILTASVTVEPTNGNPLNQRQVSGLRKLVAGSFAGLKPEHVTVTDMNGQTYSVSNAPNLGDAIDDPYYARKIRYEAQLVGKIRETLAYIPGVQVQVSAELNKEVRHVEERTKIDDNPVTIRSRTTTVTKAHPYHNHGGPVEVEAQRANGVPLSLRSSSRVRPDEEEKSTEIQNLVSSGTVTSERWGMTPQRVRASIAIPTSYLFQVWHAQHETNVRAVSSHTTPPNEQDLQELGTKIKTSIQQAVAALLPSTTPGEDLLSLVTVTTFQSLRPTPRQFSSATKNAVSWTTKHWNILLIAGMATVLLALFRVMTHKVAEKKPIATAANCSLHQSGNATQQERPKNESPSEHHLTKRTSLQDDLATMVRKDPDLAANILRNWLGKAG